MKRWYQALVIMVLIVFSATSWANCPQDTLDRGECDTMYVQSWLSDTLLFGEAPYFTRVSIYITADVNDIWDSISTFVIPLCYTHTNPSNYCSLSSYWNKILWNPSNLPRSIFRHLAISPGDTVHNWMMDLFNAGYGEEWNSVFLNLDGTSHFWLSLIPTGSEDPKFGAGNKVLLATLTFKLQDSMQICLDTCFWPPSSNLAWVIASVGGGTAITKIPRPGTDDPNSFKVCFNLRSLPQYLTDTLTVIAFSPVDLIVTDPQGDSIGLGFNTIPSAFYDTTTDYNHDGDKDDIVTIPNRLVGDYLIEVVAEPGGSGTYELGIRIDGGAPAMLTMPGGNPCPGPGEVDLFTYHAPWYKSGDANGNWNVDVGDVVYLINYLFKNGPDPDPFIAGDANCDGVVDVGDVVYLINYLFKGGLPPTC